MASFDSGISGIASLKAVNEWIGVINSNLGGVNRTAYKGTKISFGGGVTNILRDPRLEKSGIQTPSSSLNIDYTSIDFSQGTIIADGEETHFAINGEGFFVVMERGTHLGDVDQAYNRFSGASLNGSGKVYLTRDGDFFWGLLETDPDDLYLMTKDGLLVLSDKGNNNNIYRTISKSGFHSALPKRPSILLPNEPLQSLRFTRYGSTVFEVTGKQNPTGITAHDPSLPNPVNTSIATLVEKALETSNSSLNDVLPELSLAQKLFSSVSKIINVHNSNLDVTVNLVR